jgi:hypothetical protein
VYEQVRAQVYDQVDEQVRAQVYDQVDDQVDDQVYDQVDDQVYAQVYAQVRAQVNAQVNAQVYEQVRAQVYDQVYDQVNEQVNAQVYEQVRDQVNDQVRDQVSAQVHAQVREQVDDQVYDQVRDQVREQVRADMKDFWKYYRGGNLWASWYSYVSFFRDVCGYHDDSLQKFALDEAIALNAGWSLWNATIATLSDRPAELRRNDRHQFHCTFGPALLYRDGWAIYAINGVRVTEQIVMRPGTLTAADVAKESNQEVRRIMIERMGYQKYLRESGATLAHSDQRGKLWKAKREGDTDLAMVEVLNSTPEPDGTTKTYFLRVPPTITRASEGIAWTFNMSAVEYSPQVET